MRGTEFHDYYKLLGLSTSATAADIKARYRSLSKLHHPDRGGNQSEMARINLAYATLSNAFKRNIYDAERRRYLQSLRARYEARQARSDATATTPRRTHTPTTAEQQFATPKPRKHSKLWTKLAIGFAGLVILGGIVMHLPIAEAIATPTNEINAAAKPLDVTYPDEHTAPASQPSAAPATPSPVPEPAPQQPTTNIVSPAPATNDTRREKLREFCAVVTKNKLCTESTINAQEVDPTKNTQ